MDKKDFSGISINGSRYLLMELPMGDIPNYTEDVIYRLRLRGVVPVIAHPERNIRIQEDPNRYYELVDLGALGQVNTGSICGRFGSRVQKCAHILIEHNLVHVLGTDAHSSGTRSPRMREAIRLISKLFGEEQATQMAVHRPRRLSRTGYWRDCWSRRNIKSQIPFSFGRSKRNESIAFYEDWRNSLAVVCVICQDR